MRLIEPIQYTLQLNTDEIIDVLELDSEREVILNNDVVRSALASILEHCSYVTRISIEEAKKHHPKKLEALLRTAPIGALIKFNKLCASINNCPMSSRKECITSNVTKKFGKFPICWTYGVEEKLSNDDLIIATDLANHAVQAWRLGRYVLIVRS
jgi:hypothetical protein